MHKCLKVLGITMSLLMMVGCTPGPQGEKGNGILSIIKTDTIDNVDTYTIYYTDGSTTTFTVTNGETGEQGIQGESGKDGCTPIVTIGENGNWFINGIDSGVTAKGEKGETGEKGEKGDSGFDGSQGVPGKDGSSMLTGEGTPSDDLGKVNDSYIDITNWDFYVKQENGWVYKGNIKIDPKDHEGTEGLIFYPINENECAVDVGTAKLLKEIEIPETYKNYDVTTIINYGFQNCSNLEKIILPQSIKSIGIYSFSNCKNLSSIFYKGTIANWCDISFNCKDVNYLTSNVSNLYMLNEQNEFYKPTEIIISDDITSIGDYQFYRLNQITNVRIISNDSIKVGKGAFEKCESLESFYVDGSSNLIDDYAFRYSSLKNVNIYGDIEKIGESAFEMCVSLESFYVDGSLNLIEAAAFRCCNKLIDLNVSQGIKSINGAGVFEMCNLLTGIVLSKDFTITGDSVFYGCYALENVFYRGNIEEWCNLNFDGYTNIMYYASNLYVLDSYGWIEIHEIKIPSSITKIGKGQFAGFSNLKTIEIHENVTEIGARAFNGCTELTIFCHMSSKPDAWSTNWYGSAKNVYFKGQWEYDENGKCVPII